MSWDDVAEKNKPFALRLEPSPEGTIVWARGDLDLAAAEELRSAVRVGARDQRRVILDLAETDFIDGACLGAIIAARKEAGAGTEVVLRKPNRIVTKLLRITHLDEELEIEGPET